MRFVVDRNVVMRSVTVLLSSCLLAGSDTVNITHTCASVWMFVCAFCSNSVQAMPLMATILPVLHVFDSISFTSLRGSDSGYVVYRVRGRRVRLLSG